MSGGEVAGILVAVFWAIMVSFLAVALFRLAQTLRAAGDLVARVTEEAVPLLSEANATVRSAHTQLARVDAIASDVQEVTANASALSTTVSSAFGGPLVKVAAFGYGVRRALGRDRGPAAADADGTVIVGGTVGGASRGPAGGTAGAAAGKTAARAAGTATARVPAARRGLSARRRKG